MELFRLSTNSDSFGSCSSNSSTITESDTPRTSLDSTEYKDIQPSTNNLSNPSSPLLRLPIELVCQISTHLSPDSKASFSLISRYTYHALGTGALSTYISSSKNRFETRKRIENVVERAFPSNWFCAWCDKFHAWSSSTGPLEDEDEGRRECSVFNGYLSTSSSPSTCGKKRGKKEKEEKSGEEYTLRHHHIRLAINAANHGPTHGIPLTRFTHETKKIVNLGYTPIPTHLRIQSKIISGTSFLLHTQFALIIPSHLTTSPSLQNKISNILPHILSGPAGHTNMLQTISTVARGGKPDTHTRKCEACRSDWSVNGISFHHASGGQVRLVIRTWRDLGGGRNPFDGWWRAHGNCGVENNNMQGSRFSGVRMRDDGRRVGEIRRAFEMGGVVGDDGLLLRKDECVEECLGGRWWAVPRWWRTREENEEVGRREVEERVEARRSLVEDLIRGHAGRGWMV